MAVTLMSLWAHLCGCTVHSSNLQVLLLILAWLPFLSSVDGRGKSADVHLLNILHNLCHTVCCPFDSPCCDGADRADLAQRPSSGLRRHSWSREVVRISPPSPTALTPFATSGRPPLAVPSAHDAALMPSPSLPVPSFDQVHHAGCL